MGTAISKYLTSRKRYLPVVTKSYLAEYAAFAGIVSCYHEKLWAGCGKVFRQTTDGQGILRYAINPLVRWLEDHVSLNDMWIAYRRQGAWTREQFMQFYRDIGYSLNGFDEIWGEELSEMEESQ